MGSIFTGAQGIYWHNINFISINSLSAFLPFKSAVDALANANSISEGIPTEELRNFIATNLPKKLKKFVLGVSDPKLGGALSEQLVGLKVIWFLLKSTVAEKV